MIFTLASLSAFGKNAGVVWEFAAGALIVLLALALIAIIVTYIRRLIDSAGGSRF